MSIMSAYRPDNSSAMYKRFAHLASTYVDQPEMGASPVAQIPLENLFRLFEMYRYDAFKDENRSGVLALRSFSDASLRRRPKPWHTEIEAALNAAISTAFTGLSKEVAIDRIEEVLKQLTNKQNLDNDQQVHAKQFFESFGKALA